MKSAELFKLRQLPQIGLLPLLLIVAALYCPPLQAIEVQGLYQASVPVASRTDERERQRAFSPAMRQVLLKVTGRASVLELPSIRRALNNPQSYVESYAYRTIQNQGAASDNRESIALEVAFFSTEILRLLNENNVPVWPGNRPITLVWAVIQNELGERRVLSASEETPAKALLREEAAGRGLPVLFPLMDFEDLRAVGVDAIWNQDLEVLRDASRRYQAESLLVIRIFSSISGENIGRTVYAFRDRQVSRELYGANLEDTITEPVEIAVEELSGYYGVLLSGTNSNVLVRLTVENINSPRDYATLIKYVEQLADVNSVSIDSVEKEIVNLELATGGQIRQLVETIALDNNMLPVAEFTREGDEVSLHYRWTAE